MAYDPKDPADKKIFDDAIAAALAEQQAEHEADIAGLKSKNASLLEKIKKGGENGDSAAEIAKLEEELAANKKAQKELEKSLRTVTGERDTFKSEAETEKKVAHNLLVETGLTDALTSVNVAPQFLPAVKAMLKEQVSLKADGETRTAMVGDKPLGEFVKSWAQGEQGKHYVAAPSNNGGGALGGQGQPGGKTMSRTAYETAQASDPDSVAKFFKEGGTLTDG